LTVEFSEEEVKMVVFQMELNKSQALMASHLNSIRPFGMSFKMRCKKMSFKMTLWPFSSIFMKQGYKKYLHEARLPLQSLNFGVNNPAIKGI
jgi:hypothetical protein